ALGALWTIGEGHARVAVPCCLDPRRLGDHRGDETARPRMAADQRRTGPGATRTRARSRARAAADAATRSPNRHLPPGSVAANHPGSLMPLSRTSLPQRAISSLRNWPNSAGVFGAGTAPDSTSFWLTAGSLMACLNAALSAAMTAGGVLAGANSPYQLSDAV